MRKLTGLLTLCLLLVTAGGCGFVDSMFLNRPTQEAMKEADQAREEAKEAKAELASAQEAVALAKTDEQKAVAAAAQASASERVMAAADRLEAAEAGLDEALESSVPSTAESIAGLLDAFGVPWLGTLLVGSAGVYKYARAKKGDKATAAFIEGVEDIADTPEGEALKDKLTEKFEKKGLTKYIDGTLRVMGLFKKHAGQKAEAAKAARAKAAA